MTHGIFNIREVYAAITAIDIVLLQVLYRVKLSIDDEDKLKFFTSFPPDPVNRGSLQLRTGALIGLPSTFYYRSVGDVEHSSIFVGQENVDWNSPAGEELQNALVLSDKAKAFVIAREIYDVKSFSVHTKIVLLSFNLILAYLSGAALNRKFFLTLRLKPWARFCVFSALAGAWTVAYIAVSDALHCWYENRADESVAQLRKIYAEGGVEYYDAVLQRNRALRTLLGSKGNKQYTYYGNVVSVWRNPSVQLTSRRDNLQKYLAQYEHKETVNPPDDDQKQADTAA